MNFFIRNVFNRLSEQGIIQKKYGRKQNTDVPKTCKMAARGPGCGVISKAPKSADYFRLKHGKTAIVKVKIR